MTDFKHVEQQIAELESLHLFGYATTMQALLDAARAAGRIYNRPIHNQSDEDRLRDDLAKLQERRK
ncbi:MAG: hypothetical protein ACW99G_20130 [Candidatus Thorarchaeota archaeon]|jgi:hypothetical protein